MFRIGTQIAYIPNHAGGDVKHPDVEFGFVTGYSPSGIYAFCRFWRKGQPGVLRTTANGESCDPENLIEYESATAGEVESAMRDCGYAAVMRFSRT